MKVTTKFPNNLIYLSKRNKITLCRKLFIYKTISKGKYIIHFIVKGTIDYTE